MLAFLIVAARGDPPPHMTFGLWLSAAITGLVLGAAAIEGLSLWVNGCGVFVHPCGGL